MSAMMLALNTGFNPMNKIINNIYIAVAIGIIAFALTVLTIDVFNGIINIVDIIGSTDVVGSTCPILFFFGGKHAMTLQCRGNRYYPTDVYSIEPTDVVESYLDDVGTVNYWISLVGALYTVDATDVVEYRGGAYHIDFATMSTQSVGPTLYKVLTSTVEKVLGQVQILKQVVAPCDSVASVEFIETIASIEFADGVDDGEFSPCIFDDAESLGLLGMSIHSVGPNGYDDIEPEWT
jgi:hypothetical protein